MYHQEFDPPATLRDTIRCFWYNRRDAGESDPAFEVMPDGYAEIIFYFGSPLRVFIGESLQPIGSPFLMGLLHHPVCFHTNGPVEIMGIRCFPWTVFDLLQLPPGKDGVRILEHPIARLQPAMERAVSCGQIGEALDLLTQYLMHEQMQEPSGSMLFKAGTAMRKANGTTPVSEVAAAAHATVRTLERRFKQSSGYSVKDVSGLMRFEQVRNHLWHHPGANLAGLAHELGYADQSHLSKEFKRYSGTTPAAFARKAKKGLANLPDFVAFVQA